jgi:hypothetical protein
MIWHAEASVALPEEHGGSQKDKLIIEQVLNKRLSFDIVRQLCTTFGMAGTADA